MNILSVDLELDGLEIIQVGFSTNEDHFPKYDWMVYKRDLSEHFINLTGISQIENYKFGYSKEQVNIGITQFIQEYKPNLVIDWGANDFHQMKKYFDLKFPYIPHVDVKSIYSFLQIAKKKNYRGKLQGAMAQYKLKFSGRPHRADVDAYNTLRFFNELLRTQTIVQDFIKEIK